MNITQIKMSDRLKAAIQHVAGDCASDVGECEGMSMREVLAETALDANRMTMWGYKDADDEASALVKEHGYDAVLKEAAKHVY